MWLQAKTFREGERQVETESKSILNSGRDHTTFQITKGRETDERKG